MCPFEGLGREWELTPKKRVDDFPRESTIFAKRRSMGQWRKIKNGNGLGVEERETFHRNRPTSVKCRVAPTKETICVELLEA